MHSEPELDALFARFSLRVHGNDLPRVKAAWQIAKAAHDGQTRQSGEPYITHPLAVADLIIDSFGPDADALCAALLHDVVEDSEVSLAELRAEFGAEVALIVDGVSKLEEVPTLNAEAAKEETLRKLITAGGCNWRAYAVKLCDRLHNMSTLGATSRAKQLRVSKETQLIFCPLARYVGFHDVASRLESLVLQFTYPWRWSVIGRWAAYKHRIDRARALRFFTDNAKPPSALSVLGANFEPDPYSELRAFSLLREDRSARALFSVPTFHVHTKSLAAAYETLGFLHERFTYVAGSFIFDRPNRVLSSKILLGKSGPVIEIVLRFPVGPSGISLDEFGAYVARFGDDFSAVAVSSEGQGEFSRTLRELVNQKSVSVFSPKGQVFALPKHSTVLDFAFAVHTDVGLRAEAALVNGVSRDLATELVTGDIVEVVAAPNVIANASWEEKLRSPRARAKLRHWLRESAKEDVSTLGKQLFDATWRSLGETRELTDAEWLSAVLYTGVSDKFELWGQFARGLRAPYAVAAEMLGIARTHEDDGEAVAAQLPPSGFAANASPSTRLLLDGAFKPGISYCPECRPLPEDAIVASVADGGLQVHRESCALLLNRRSALSYVSPVWAPEIVKALPARFAITTTDRRGLLADCSRVIADEMIDVTGVRTHSVLDAKTPYARLEFDVLVRHAAELQSCLDSLKSKLRIDQAERI